MPTTPTQVPPAPRVPLFLQSHPAARCIRLSPDGNHQLDLCEECLRQLTQGRVPDHALARCDTGLRPPDLPQLTLLEERIVALVRVVRHIVVCRPPTSHIPVGEQEGHTMLRSHIIGFQGPTPIMLARAFPCHPSALPDLISVILIGAAQTYDDVLRLAHHSSALFVRGRVIALWARHLATIYADLPDCQLDQAALQAWDARPDSHVPDELVQNALYTETAGEANALLQLIRQDQQGYASTRYGTQEQAAAGTLASQPPPPPSVAPSAGMLISALFGLLHTRAIHTHTHTHTRAGAAATSEPGPSAIPTIQPTPAPSTAGPAVAPPPGMLPAWPAVAVI